MPRDVEIRTLESREAAAVLPALYEILCNNMNGIDPAEGSYEDGMKSWTGIIAKALEKPQRKMLLLYAGGELAGFFMYYVNNGVFMMEEIQFKTPYQGTGLFQALYRHLIEIIPGDTETVEAYAHKRNTKSQGVLGHLGLAVVGENKDGSCWHYRGSYPSLVSVVNGQR